MSKNALDQAVAAIIHSIGHQPADQVIAELTVVIERLRFVPEVHTVLTQADSLQIKTSLNFLFQQEISPQTHIMLDALVDQHLISLLCDDQAMTIVSQIKTYLDNLDEIKIVSAVPLQDNFKNMLAARLTAGQDQTRVVFELLPSILGGCLIIDKNGSHDYSIKTNASQSIHQFMQTKAKEVRP